jgi:Fe-S-cluster containining protein
MRIKVSAKSCRQLFRGCDLGYMVSVCHGRCCGTAKGATIAVLPDEAARIEGVGGKVVGGFLENSPDGRCPFQQADGLCAQYPHRPWGCRLSPFTLRGTTLVIKNRNRLLCCYKAEPSVEAYRAYRGSLDALFGEAESARIAEHLDAGGGDLVAEMPDDRFSAASALVAMYREKHRR